MHRHLGTRPHQHFSSPEPHYYLSQTGDPLLVDGERGTFGSHSCSDGPAGLPTTFCARTGRATGDRMGQLQFPWSVQSRDGAHRKQANTQKATASCSKSTEQGTGSGWRR